MWPDVGNVLLFHCIIYCVLSAVANNFQNTTVSQVAYRNTHDIVYNAHNNI